ncbi:ABC transporter substrate-binding protein [Alsobacter metallidurans]|uniref:ABC transporter substrate-binding protein n=1 Tax=Alsobacter metallidurans TaxID=340221 RepID=A0A917I9Y3_9HYPH|nr:TRAP transporter substrate-binding protein [Alsobacter metallidurans]GGH24051.1 ABC transporter substrate-binding protein [Alsobacter metallidurans]
MTFKHTTDRSTALSRRSLLAGAAASIPLFAIGTGRARAAEFSFKVATGQSLTQPINARLEQACARIQQASGGRLEMKFFPASQLGSDTDLITQVRSGGIEFLNIAGSVISTVAAGAAITNVGFAFADYDQAWRGVDGAIGEYVKKQIEKAGLQIASKASDNSFRQITSATKPIKNPADLKDYRIRVPVSPIFTSLFSSLGANPTSINFNELYTALQTKLVDGQENGLVAIDSGKLYEVQKYVSETNHIWDPFWLVGNRRAIARLPADLQEIVGREFDRASLEQRDDVAKLNGSLKAQLSAKGLVFEAADKPAFRSALTASGFYKTWKDKFGAEAWSVLESVTGELA